MTLCLTIEKQRLFNEFNNLTNSNANVEEGDF